MMKLRNIYEIEVVVKSIGFKKTIKVTRGALEKIRENPYNSADFLYDLVLQRTIERNNDEFMSAYAVWVSIFYFALIGSLPRFEYETISDIDDDLTKIIKRLEAIIDD